MQRLTLVASALLIASSISAFGQIVNTSLPDPNIGICTNPTSSTCGADPNIINSATAFGVYSFGGNDSQVPWYLLLAIPETAAGGVTAGPTITGPSGFTVSAGVRAAGDFSPTTKGDIYSFASALDNNEKGDGSMNESNLFGLYLPNQKPADFAVFVYTVSPGALMGNTGYEFGSSGIPAGTFLAALGVDTKGAQMSTPFTTSGFDDGPNIPPVPEPASIVLLATTGLIAGVVYRRKTRAN